MKLKLENNELAKISEKAAESSDSAAVLIVEKDGPKKNAFSVAHNTH